MSELRKWQIFHPGQKVVQPCYCLSPATAVSGLHNSAIPPQRVGVRTVLFCPRAEGVPELHNLHHSPSEEDRPGLYLLLPVGRSASPETEFTKGGPHGAIAW